MELRRPGSPLPTPQPCPTRHTSSRHQATTVTLTVTDSYRANVDHHRTGDSLKVAESALAPHDDREEFPHIGDPEASPAARRLALRAEGEFPTQLADSTPPGRTRRAPWPDCCILVKGKTASRLRRRPQRGGCGSCASDVRLPSLRSTQPRWSAGRTPCGAAGAQKHGGDWFPSATRPTPEKGPLRGGDVIADEKYKDEAPRSGLLIASEERRRASPRLRRTGDVARTTGSPFSGGCPAGCRRSTAAPEDQRPTRRLACARLRDSWGRSDRLEVRRLSGRVVDLGE